MYDEMNTIDQYYIQRDHLRRFQVAVARGEATVGFLGGSITDPRGRCRWSEYVENWLVDRFPQVKFRFENAAIGATGTLSALFRVQRNLLYANCDLVLVEYAVNDRNDNRDMLEHAREGLLRKLYAAGCDVVCTYTFCNDMLPDLLAGCQPYTIAGYETLCGQYGTASVFMGDWAREQVRRGLVRWEELLPDGVHPANCGSRYYAEPVCALLEAEIARKPTDKLRTLPDPLRADHWQGAYELDLRTVTRKGPWMYRNLMDFPCFDHALYTASTDAALEFSFDGTGFALTLNFGWLCSEFEWRIDGGDWQRGNWDRYDWMDDLGWPCTTLMCCGLERAPHRVEIRTLRDAQSTAKGSIFEICGIGIIT